MKVKSYVTTTICVNLDVDAPVFEEIYKIHKEEEVAPAEMYEEAVKIIESTLGLPFGDDSASTTTTIVSVIASEDDVPILEW